VLLGDTHIVATVRKSLCEQIEPGSGRHGRRDRDDAFVLLRLGDQSFGENFGVAGRLRGRLALLAREHVEFDDAMIFVRRRFGRRIALAFCVTT